MATSELWLHESLLSEVAAGLASDHADALMTQLTAVVTNPHTAGSRMRHIQVQALQGKVRKVHISGPGGFRMAYFVETLPPGAPGGVPVIVVCPFFFSMDQRSRFDWDDFDWQGTCAGIYESLQTGRDQDFTCWKLGA